MKEFCQSDTKRFLWKGFLVVGLFLSTVTSGTILSLTQPVWAADTGPGLTETELAEMRTEVHRKKHSFRVGHNVATRYKISQLCGLQPSLAGQQTLTATQQPKLKMLTALPSRFDWRDVDGVTPVRNQGNCGSCWAFSTLGVLEANIKIKDKQDVDLSEQYLISCNRNNWGCNGGWWAFNMLTSGAALESSFPYRAADVPCQTVSTPYKIERWGYVGSSSGVPSVEAIKNAIYQYGPVTVAVYVERYFQAYQGGIFDRNANGRPNHGVVLTGWDDSQGCWIMRNSWGPNWGESGYMRIKYGTSSIGYAAAYAVYKGGVTPTAVPTSTPTPTTSVRPTPTTTVRPTPTLSPSPTPSPTITPGSDNLALNQTAQASGSLSGYEASKAVDGNYSTRWAASAYYTQWLAVNLKRSCTSGVVKIKWSQTNYARRYVLQGLVGNRWVNLKTVTGDGDWDNITFSSSSPVGRLRIACTSRASSYYLIYELEVYSSSAQNTKKSRNVVQSRGRR